MKFPILSFSLLCVATIAQAGSLSSEFENQKNSAENREAAQQSRVNREEEIQNAKEKILRIRFRDQLIRKVAAESGLKISAYESGSEIDENNSLASSTVTGRHGRQVENPNYNPVKDTYDAHAKLSSGALCEITVTSRDDIKRNPFATLFGGPRVQDRYMQVAFNCMRAGKEVFTKDDSYFLVNTAKMDGFDMTEMGSIDFDKVSPAAAEELLGTYNP